MNLTQGNSNFRKDAHLGKRKLGVLSFALEVDDSEDEDDANQIADTSTVKIGLGKIDRKIGAMKAKKNPEVDTTHLPDRERDEAVATKRAELAAAWIAEQSRVKDEYLKITYSYWEGSGHRKEVRVI